MQYFAINLRASSGNDPTRLQTKTEKIQTALQRVYIN